MLTLNLINLALKTSIKNNFFSTDIKTEMEKFLNKNKYIDKNSIVICLIYLRRYKENGGILNKNNLLDIIITSILLSNKFLMDGNIKGSTKEEANFVNIINWNLFIKVEEFNHALQFLTNHYPHFLLEFR